MLDLRMPRYLRLLIHTVFFITSIPLFSYIRIPYIGHSRANMPQDRHTITLSQSPT